MQTYVVTGFNNNFFRYGISWIASLKELAKYNGNILVVGFNLSSLNKDRILATGAQLIEETALVDFKKITFHHLSEIANKEMLYLLIGTHSSIFKKTYQKFYV